MNKGKEKEIYAKILDIEGPGVQLEKAWRKCNELADAIFNYTNDVVPEENMERLIEKIADTYIMLGQLSRWIHEDVVMYEINHKLYNISEELKSGS